jgi:hypothetical protein
MTAAFIPLLIAAALTIPRVTDMTWTHGLRERRFDPTLETLLWNPEKAGNVRADPDHFYADVLNGVNVKLSRDALVFLRTSVAPLRVFYAPRKAMTGIPLSANHYIVYFGDLKLSTDLDYFSRFAPDDKDLLFDLPPDEQNVQRFSQMLREYRVTDVLVTPTYREQAAAWLRRVNDRAPILEPIFDRDGYTVYEVHVDLIALGGGN